ncbi:hypothetical protein [Neobacillus sp. B4I6]|uniref:hypothetical protein n=1 Tax=Neobacillus sp. B4I6 TaxID=3373925 RepID=UPI003D1A4482
MVTDIGEMRLAQAEIKALEEDMELLKQVSANKVNVMKGQLEDKAEEMFKAHKSAVFLYRTVDNYILVNTSLAELKDTLASITSLTLTVISLIIVLFIFILLLISI